MSVGGCAKIIHYFFVIKAPQRTSVPSHLLCFAISMGNNIGKRFCSKCTCIFLPWNDGYQHSWHTSIAILLLVYRFVLIIGLDAKQPYISGGKVFPKEKANFGAISPVSKSRDSDKYMPGSKDEENGQYCRMKTGDVDDRSKGTIQCVAMGESAECHFKAYCQTFLKDWDTAWYEPEKLRGLQGKFLLIVSSESCRIGDTMEEAEKEWSDKLFLKDGKEWMMVVVSFCLKNEESNSSDTVLKQHKPSFVRDLTNILYDEHSHFNKCIQNELSCVEIESFLTLRLHTSPP